MNAYIGLVMDLSTGKTVYNLTKKAIVAQSESDAIEKLIALASGKIAYDPLKHHPIVQFLERLPENLG